MISVDLRPLRKALRKLRQKKLFKFFILLLAVFACLLFIFERNIRPLVTQMAATRAQYLANKAINSAIEEVVNIENVQYTDLISFEKDDTGKINALKTNIVKINTLKAEVVEKILEKINSIDSSDLKIPLGNIIDGELLSGRGPKINIKIVPIGSVTCTFENAFKNAGINQTHYQIILKATVTMSVLLPGASTSITVNSEVSIAETIIVGDVPNTYFDIQGSTITPQK